MKVFLSAVSAQFKPCRDALASDLRAVGCEVKVQEDFQQHGRTLLEGLETYIAECDRVIALVGDAYGLEPPEPARPPGKPRRSYTQWEYFFALGERLDGGRKPRKDIFVYFASPRFLAENPVDQGVEQTALQLGFGDAIRQSGEYRGNPFDSLDQICRWVLHDGWRLQERPLKTVHLPYQSLDTLFKGREGFLTQLHERLKHAVNGHATAIVGRALHGLGGVGKTRLAVEYAWQHETDYSALLFVVTIRGAMN